MANIKFRVLCQWAAAYPDERCREWAEWGTSAEFKVVACEAHYLCDKHKHATDFLPGPSPYKARIG